MDRRTGQPVGVVTGTVELALDMVSGDFVC